MRYSFENVAVLVGEVKTVKNGELLQAILGSCVGVCFLWREQNICGLAHCLLPTEGKLSKEKVTARHVNQGVQALLVLMGIDTAAEKKEIEALVAGGGSMMTQFLQRDLQIGKRNIEAAIKCLARNGIENVHVIASGAYGTKVTIDSSNYTYQIKSIPKLGENQNG